MSHGKKFPLGRRGERPVRFSVRGPWELIKELTSIPGVARCPGGVECTWDAAPVVAARLGVTAPTPPTEANIDLNQEVLSLPGRQRYLDLGFKDKLRPYQRFGAVYLARRAYAMNCDPMRSGKSVQSLAASVLIGADKVLIVAPALAKFVWADEVAKWVGESAVILEGRSPTLVKRYCLACGARGKMPDGSQCQACLHRGRSTGFIATRVRELKLVKDLSTQVDVPTSDGSPAYRTIQYYSCPVHLDVIEETEGLCKKCLEELHAVVRSSKYVIVNYDILVSQKSADVTGKLFTREDLPGWAPFLAHHKFDVAIADEIHLARGWSSGTKNKGQTRRERFIQVTENIERVWGLTGTPIFGYVRDLWGQLDAISKGAVTGTGYNNRLPFSFHAYFCAGRKGEYGWEADGRSEKADTELPARLELIKLQRRRSDVLKDMPAKVRQVIRIDADDKTKKALVLSSPRGGRQHALTRLLKQTFDIKKDAIVESLINELSEGNKVVAFTFLRESAEKLSKALAKAMGQKDIRARMREVNAETWTAHGDTSPEVRFALARGFREHTGAGVFIATTDAVQVAVSLKGASSVHFAELHWQPAALLQAEDRPYEVGTTGLSIIYYVVRNSIDEHIEATVLPKVQTLADIVNEQGAHEMKKAFEGEQETVEEIYARILAGMGSDSTVIDLDDISEVDVA